MLTWKSFYHHFCHHSDLKSPKCSFWCHDNDLNVAEKCIFSFLIKLHLFFFNQTLLTLNYIISKLKKDFKIELPHGVFSNLLFQWQAYFDFETIVRHHSSYTFSNKSYSCEKVFAGKITLHRFHSSLQYWEILYIGSQPLNSQMYRDEKFADFILLWIQQFQQGLTGYLGNFQSSLCVIVLALTIAPKFKLLS